MEFCICSFDRLKQFHPFATQPPSTNIICPVTKSEAALARYIAAQIKSSGVAKRPNGILLRIIFKISPCKRLSRLGVLTAVGAITLILIPFCAHSTASDSVRCTSR